jgi:hypothetical protein
MYICSGSMASGQGSLVGVGCEVTRSCSVAPPFPVHFQFRRWRAKSLQREKRAAARTQPAGGRHPCCVIEVLCVADLPRARANQAPHASAFLTSSFRLSRSLTPPRMDREGRRQGGRGCAWVPRMSRERAILSQHFEASWMLSSKRGRSCHCGCAIEPSPWAGNATNHHQLRHSQDEVFAGVRFLLRSVGSQIAHLTKQTPLGRRARQVQVPA